MSQSHAPGWRGRPVIRGKIEDADWLESEVERLLWTAAPWICAVAAGALLVAAVVTWVAGMLP